MSIEFADPNAGVPSIAFTGRRGRAFLIVLKNVLLTVLTLGIYRFWAKTAVRRYFWANTRIADEPLEYTGRGLELFIGFLIVLAVLVPLGMLFGAAQSFLGMAAPWVDPALSILNFLAILFLIQLAVFRMTRYRLTRTRWRGIRCGLDGKPLHYAVRGFLWLLASVPTLGFSLPFMTVDLARYRVNRMRFGTEHFAFDAPIGALFVPWLIRTLPLAAGLIGFLALNGPWLETMADALVRATHDGMATIENLPSPEFVGLPIAGALLWGVLSVWYRVRAFRVLVGGIRFAGARFESRLSVGRVFWLILASGILVLLILGALLAAAAALGHAMGDVPAAVLVGLAPLLFLVVAMPFVTIVLWRVGATRAVCRTLILSDLTPFAHAAQAASSDPRFGEGLADAFDVDAF